MLRLNFSAEFVPQAAFSVYVIPQGKTFMVIHVTKLISVEWSGRAKWNGIEP